jgi:hypothetical protein
VSDLRVIPWIRGLDEARAVALARSLIHAEAGRLGLPLSDHSISGRVKASDQGVDGRTHFPAASKALLPVGPQIWQIKSGASPPSASKEFDTKHVALIDAIREGYNYVLFWTNDPVDTKANPLKTQFELAIEQIRPDAKATFLFADSIEGLCYAHLAVLLQGPALPLRGVVSLSTWGKRQDFNIPFQSDSERSRRTEAIRSHVKSEDSSTSTLHLYCDTGVGKSRLVYEALAEEGVAERVLIALDPADLDRSLLTLVAESPDRRLILVVDDCTAADRQAVTRYADLAEGRVRLITVGSRYSRDPQPIDSRYLELLPLATTASREIALALGLSETNADIVAEYTEGYPKLAFVLADAISRGTGANLLERIRSEAVGSVLSSMLTNPNDINLLGGLALFEKLGFEEEMAQETSIVCEAFGIDETLFREVVNRELRRFVSDAGRYRLVTPRLFAVWLAAEFLQRNRNLADALQGLPETLRDRMIGQMKAFAGNTHIGAALHQLFTQYPFATGVLNDVDAGSARLLHVAAIVDPSLAIDVIDSLLESRSTAELRESLERGRRGFVNALEVLIWFSDTFERAAWALLRLAIAENEQWSNNATGAIQGIFRVFLGGTSTPYTERLAWTRSALARYPESAPILATGLANSLTSHEMRTSPEFASRIASPEWRPQTASEEIAARRGAWQLLIEIARSDHAADEVVTSIAAGLRTAAMRGIAEDILNDLNSISWSADARVQLAETIGHLLRYDGPPPEIASRFEDLRASLIGTTREDKLSYLLNQEPWQLYEHGRLDAVPLILTEVADQLVSGGQEVIVEAAARSRSTGSRTTELLFEQVALALASESLQAALEAEYPVPEDAVVGSLVGLAKIYGDSWASERLSDWLRSSLGHLVIQAVHKLPPTHKLAELAVKAVRDGHSSSSELGRFLYGAWARSLPSADVAAIAQNLGRSDQPHSIEQGLGIISQWLGEHPGYAESDLYITAIDLIEISTRVPTARSNMTALYRQQVLARLNVSPDIQLNLLSKILSSINYPLSDPDLDLIDSVTRTSPSRTIEMVIAIILGNGGGSYRLSALWLESSKLLSRLATTASAASVITEIETIPQDRWRELIGHISFSSSNPDPLIEYMISKSTDEVVRGRAASSFIYPENAWIGPESDYLRGRRSVAVSWLDSVSAAETRQWLLKVLEEIDLRIRDADRMEAEEEP